MYVIWFSGLKFRFSICTSHPHDTSKVNLFITEKNLCLPLKGLELYNTISWKWFNKYNNWCGNQTDPHVSNKCAFVFYLTVKFENVITFSSEILFSSSRNTLSSSDSNFLTEKVLVSQNNFSSHVVVIHAVQRSVDHRK